MFSFCMQVDIVAVGTLTLKCTKTHIQAQDSHIPAVAPLKHKQERVHTHIAAHSKGDVAALLTCYGGPCFSGSESCGE